MFKNVMNRISAIALQAGLLAFSAVAAAEPAQQDSGRPNVVFFLVDDLGMMDLACYGSDFHETPNIDRLAKEGVQFANAYASHAVCGPSRSAIMTGRFPARLGCTSVGGSVAGNVIWPKVFKDAGYTTYFTGKWHMGSAESVQSNGFDYNVAGHSKGQPGDYYFPYKGVPSVFDVPGLEDGKDGDFLTDVLTDKALHFLDQHGDESFLLYFSYYNVHKPAGELGAKGNRRAQGKKEHVDYFKQKLATLPDPEQKFAEETHGNQTVWMATNQRNAEFAAQIKSVDESVGRVMDKLQELGVADRTVVVFTSDQGSMGTTKGLAVSSALPYRFGKSFNYEGGLRVPLLIKWPGCAAAGSVNETVTVNTDFYPTMLEGLGLDSMPEQHLDGQSILPAIKGALMPLDRTLYWAYPNKHGLGHKPSVAARQGPYKLIYWMADGHAELYNVEKDPAECINLTSSHPEVAARLMTALEEWEPMQKQMKRK
ncbi:sulfatase [Pontiella sulfatireligans]|uniref:Choline-sulfatase n=1 Tax=Pontiella sulfatireligans TaxID=2750658 RepID=A0A6C2UFP3_9BACT|nr:sulfatase [Pontiella sulfatireligans]SPS74122.1 sulfatase S1_16 [Kiritimatiellales bacterium]VGO18026.1 Choline-sulfatase [Pontiella sulfatireligans]